jgi:AcrR family transcriptional regulator
VTQHPAAPRSRLTGQQRRESILGVATEVFAEMGYQRARTSDIAAKVGVSEPVIFQNFGSKAALFAAVVDRAGTQICTILEQAVDQGGSVANLVTAWLTPQLIEAAHAPGGFGAVFADSAWATEPEVAAAARDARQRIAAGLTALLDRGQREGDIRPDLDPAAAAWWLLSLAATQRLRAADMPHYRATEAGVFEMTRNALLANDRTGTAPR